MLKNQTEVDHGGNVTTWIDYSVILKRGNAVVELYPPHEDDGTENWGDATTGEAVTPGLVARLITFAELVLVRVHYTQEGPDIPGQMEWIEYDMALAEKVRLWAESEVM